MNVAPQVGLDFRQGAFRYGKSLDTTAMMGGGLCWLDYDSDGWLDLFVVNSHADVDIVPSDAHGGLPRTALYHNVGGRFVDVSSRAGADLPIRGDGCVAADFNLDGHTDLYVTSAGYNVATDSWDALLWNNGDGTFTEGAVQAGINGKAWHSAAVVGDVNGDGRPDLFVSSYTDPNFVVDPASGFPSDHAPVRDLLYLNEGTDENGHSTFREVARPGGHREDEGRARPRSDLHGLQPRRASRPVRRERRGSQPALRERRAEGRRRRRSRAPRLPPRGRRETRGRRRPERGHGNRGTGLHRRRTDRHLRHQLARPAARRLPEPQGGKGPVVRRRAPRVRSCSRLAPGGMGRVVGRPGPRRRSRPRPGERRDPRREPREGRPTRADPRERVRAGQAAALRARRGPVARAHARGERTRPRGGRLRQRRRPRRRGQLDRRQARSCSGTTRRSATGWRFVSARSRRERS